MQKNRKCDTGCRRPAQYVVLATDLAFCGKHHDLYVLASTSARNQLDVEFEQLTAEPVLANQ